MHLIPGKRSETLISAIKSRNSQPPVPLIPNGVVMEYGQLGHLLRFRLVIGQALVFLTHTLTRN